MLPAIFVGHGSPMNALGDNGFTQGWRAIAASMPKPKAILAISAHWQTDGPRVTIAEQPKTIHDFGGFPRELMEVQYPAPGSRALAERVAALLQPEIVHGDGQWGLDHGTWSVLVHLYPEADVPVVQLSLDLRRSPLEHLDLARRLRPLRNEGVLILGSGNLVHNLRRYDWRDPYAEPHEWAVSFEAKARKLIDERAFETLANYEALGAEAMLSSPTPEHFLPLIYILAQHENGEQISFPVSGFEGRAVSMLSVKVGA